MADERETIFEHVNIEPSTIYTNNKFNLKIMLAGPTRMTTEAGDILNTENLEKLILE